VMMMKRLHNLRIDADRVKDTNLRKGAIEERKALKSWSMRTRRKTEMKAPITFSGSAKQRDSCSPAKVSSSFL